MSVRRQGGTSRHPQTASVVWGWRLEAALALGAFTVLRVSSQLGSGGPLLVGGIIAIALWQTPDLRAKLRARLDQARLRRKMAAAFRRCCVVGYFGDAPKITQIGRVPLGVQCVIRLPSGLHAGSIDACAAELAAALGARGLRVSGFAESAAYARILVLLREPFPATPMTSRLLASTASSLWDRVDLGRDEEGGSVQVLLPEHNLLIGGEPGAGKSVAMSNLVAAAALDPKVTLTLLDGKQVELALWEPCAETFVGPDQEEAVSTLAALQSEMDDRYHYLRSVKKRKIEPTSEFGLHVVIIDELAFYLRGGKKDVRDQFADLLRDLISRGRAAGIIVIAATQKPGHETVPTWIRDLFSYRLAMRCTSPDASDTILGQGWSTRGFSASTIDPANRGVGYLLAEGGVPVKFKASFLSDGDIELLAARATALRTGS